MAAETVIDRAKRIMPIHFPEDIYVVTVHRQEGKRPAMILTIYNRALPPNEKRFSPHGFYCIRCEIYDRDPSMLHIGLLTRCGLNGTEHLKRLIAFSKAFGLARITLEDESSIQYDTKEDATYSEHLINLQHLLRLRTGHSWYEQFGFTNRAIRQSQDMIQAAIQQPMSIYPQELFYQLQDYVEMILSDNITPDITISQAASYLYQCLQTVCPQRLCYEESDLDIVDDINRIIHEMYDGMLSWVGMKPEHFHDLQLDLLPNQQGSSRTRRKTQQRTRRTKRVHVARRKRTRRTSYSCSKRDLTRIPGGVWKS
jgi:hypothetical protein